MIKFDLILTPLDEIKNQVSRALSQKNSSCRKNRRPGYISEGQENGVSALSGLLLFSAAPVNRCGPEI